MNMNGVRLARRLASTFTANQFGIVLDIDGVLMRGRDLLPRVHEAFRLLTDSSKKFVVPTVFLTNGTNSMRSQKSDRLSEVLGIKISPEQVVMAHSPLRMFKDLHDKHVLVVGQGPVEDIAKNLGFTKITTLHKLRELFPYLDCVDFKRRKLDPTAPPAQLDPIEGILCLGEPLQWESALQFICDVLIMNGDLGSTSFKRGTPFTKQLPVVACNVDLVWMAEKGLPLPRFGHGIFLTCLEKLYETLTGRDLHYRAVLGKPTELSYMHAAHCIQELSEQMNQPPPTHVYVIGDNPESDILGARLFDRYLRHGGRGRFNHIDLSLFDGRHQLQRCVSVLVETGVYHESCRINGVVKPLSRLLEELGPGEQQELRTPNFVEADLYSAIRMVLNRERFRSPYELVF